MESGSPPRARSIRLRVGESRVPTTAGDRDDKAKQTYVRRSAAKPNRVWRGHEPIHAGVHFQFPPLISRLGLCGLTGRSAPVNLIYPLVRPLSPSRVPYFLNMTEFKSFSRWSALLFSLAGQREKERMGWAGVLLLSQMAVAGPTDVLVSASGIFNVCPGAQPMRLTPFCTVQLLSGG